jgi:sugar transferase (PEP-CTERM/EpsH1 system associated)
MPYPPLKGDSLRTFYFIKELSKRHTVDLFTFQDPGESPSSLVEMQKYCRKIETVLLSERQSYINALRSFVNFQPFQVNYYYSSDMEKKLLQLLTMTSYDIVHVVLQRMMQYASVIGSNRLVLDNIDALSLNMQRRAAVETNPVKKAVFYYEYLNMKRYEQNSIGKYNACLVTSEVDKKALADNSIHVIPNGVDTDYFVPEKADKNIDFVFTGNMGYFPNVDAAVYFCKEIFPKIVAVHPSATVYLVGIKPSKKVMELADFKNIIVTGYVEDVRCYLNRAKIFVCPLRSGSGIQNKMLEAMACALPVVTTPYGNAGIKAENGRDLIVADTAEQFAHELLLLLQDDKRRQDLGANARDLVKKGFSWEQRGRVLDKIYDDIARKTISGN